MTVVISILVLVVIIGLPTWLIVHIMKKAENEKSTPDPETIVKNFKKGFFLSFWGMDFALGSIPLMISISAWSVLTDQDEIYAAFGLGGYLLIAFIILAIGRIIVGYQSRRLNFSASRKRTELENYAVDGLLHDVEAKNGRANLMYGVARITNNTIDDIAAVTANMGILSAYSRIGKKFTGDNFLKNHWPWIPVLLLTAVFVVMTIIH